jgi:hypothetical protein
MLHILPHNRIAGVLGLALLLLLAACGTSREASAPPPLPQITSRLIEPELTGASGMLEIVVENLRLGERVLVVALIAPDGRRWESREIEHIRSQASGDLSRPRVGVYGSSSGSTGVSLSWDVFSPRPEVPPAGERDRARSLLRFDDPAAFLAERQNYRLEASYLDSSGAQRTIARWGG